MIERELVHIEERTERTPFLIETAKYEPLYTCLDYSASAHDAGFLGHVQGATNQPEIVENLGRFHDREDLRVGNRGAHVNGEVVGSCYRLTVRCDDERTNGYFVSSVSLSGLSQTELHKKFVMHTNNITAPYNKIKQIEEGGRNMIYITAWKLKPNSNG